MVEEVHSKLFPPSGAARWIACPGSVKMHSAVPDRGDTIHSREGTCAHQVFYNAQVERRPAADYVGKTYEDVLVTKEMAEYVQEAIDYVEFIPGHTRLYEQTVRMEHYIEGCYGTSDVIILDDGHLHIADLKYGKGIRVNPEFNEQLMLYAGGALEEFAMLEDFNDVTLHVLQPRLEDGFNHWTCSVDEIEILLQNAALSADLALGDEPPFNPTEKACQWCNVKEVCGARGKKLTEEIRQAFDVEEDKLPEFSTGILSAEDIARILKLKSEVMAWMSDIEEYALKTALQGRNIPGFKVVEGRSNRRWENEEEVRKKFRALKLKKSDYVIEKLISISQAEKLLGKKQAQDAFKQLVVKPEGRPTLALETDKRPEFQPASTDDFQTED